MPQWLAGRLSNIYHMRDQPVLQFVTQGQLIIMLTHFMFIELNLFNYNQLSVDKN